MKHWAKIDKDDYVVGLTGGARPGPEWVEYPEDGPKFGTRRIKRSGGSFVLTNETWMPSPTVSMRRAAAYPPIADQLDMLWHAMNDGTLPMVESFYNQIKAVKDAIPKA